MNDDNAFGVDEDEDEFGDFDGAMPGDSQVDDSFATCSSTLAASTPAAITTTATPAPVVDEENKSNIVPLNGKGNHAELVSSGDGNGDTNQSESRATDLVLPSSYHATEILNDAISNEKCSENGNDEFGAFEDRDIAVEGAGSDSANGARLILMNDDQHVQSNDASISCCCLVADTHLDTADYSSQCSSSNEHLTAASFTDNDGVLNIQCEDNEANDRVIITVEASPHMESNNEITVTIIDDAVEEDNNNSNNNNNGLFGNQLSEAISCSTDEILAECAAAKCDNGNDAQPNISESESSSEVQVSNVCGMMPFEQIFNVVVADEPVTVTNDIELIMPIIQQDQIHVHDLSTVVVIENEEKAVDDGGNRIDFPENETAVVEKLEVNDFGDFGSLDEAQKQAELVTVTEDTPITTLIEGAEFLSATYPVVESDVIVGESEIPDNNDDDGNVGGFQDKTDEEADKEAGVGDEESVNQIEERGEDDFGDFGSFDETQHEAVASSGAIEGAHGSTKDDAGIAEVSNLVVDKNKQMTANENNQVKFSELRDQIRAFPSTAKEDSSTTKQETKAGGDDFGNSSSFDEGQQESAMLSATDSNRDSDDIAEVSEDKSAAEVDHDNFGEFQDETDRDDFANEAAKEGEFSDDDDDFDDFGDFDEAQEQVHSPDNDETPNATSTPSSQSAGAATLMQQLFNGPSSVVKFDAVSHQQSLWKQPICIAAVLPVIDADTQKEMRWSAKVLEFIFPEIGEVERIDIQAEVKSEKNTSRRKDTASKNNTLNGVPSKLPDLSFMLSPTLSLPTRQKRSASLKTFLASPSSF